MIEDSVKKRLEADADGLATYEYIANHIDTCRDDIDMLVDNMDRVDHTGQFVISAARYLYAIDREGFGDAVDRLIALGIEKDRERKYIGALMEQFYGADYAGRAAELRLPTIISAGFTSGSILSRPYDQMVNFANRL